MELTECSTQDMVVHVLHVLMGKVVCVTRVFGKVAHVTHVIMVLSENSLANLNLVAEWQKL